MRGVAVVQLAQSSFRRSDYSSDPMQSTDPPSPDDVTASLRYNYGELLSHMHLFVDHTLHLSYPHLGYLNTHVGHADHNCMLFSAALNLSLLPSKSYHQYVINSNLLLKTNQVII